MIAELGLAALWLAAALAALIDAEAAKITSGPDKGRWDAQSFNSASGATGLTQFLRGTWMDHARNGTTLLNKVAKDKGLVTALDGIVSGRDSELLALLSQLNNRRHPGAHLLEAVMGTHALPDIQVGYGKQGITFRNDGIGQQMLRAHRQRGEPRSRRTEVKRELGG